MYFDKKQTATLNKWLKTPPTDEVAVAKRHIAGLLDALLYASDVGSLEYPPDGDGKDDKRRWFHPIRDAKRFLDIPTPHDDEQEEDEREAAAAERRLADEYGTTR